MGNICVFEDSALYNFRNNWHVNGLDLTCLIVLQLSSVLAVILLVIVFFFKFVKYQFSKSGGADMLLARLIQYSDMADDLGNLGAVVDQGKHLSTGAVQIVIGAMQVRQEADEH